MSNIRNFPLRRPACLLLPAVLFSSVVHAQTQAQSSDLTTLPAVVVTASGISQPQTDALLHTTVITEQDIRHSPAMDLPSLLQREAGLQITQSGGTGQPASLFIRGAAPRQVLILIDGVPFFQQGISAAPALENIALGQIESIEIVRGNVSSIYGSGAIGGVVQIFTKKSGVPSTYLSAEVGAHNSKTINAGISGGDDTVRYAVSLTGSSTSGISANNTRQYPNENPDLDGYRNNSISTSVSKEWDKGHQVGLRIYANDAKYGFDGGGFGAISDIGKGISKQESYSLFSTDRFSSDWISTVTLSSNSMLSSSNYASSENPVYGIYSIRDKTDSTLLQWKNEINLNNQWSAVAGLDTGNHKLDAFSNTYLGVFNGKFERSTSSVYAGLNGKIDVHQWQFNVRHDQVGGSGSETTGLLGYGYFLTPSVKLTASTSTAFNAPTLAQLYDGISGNAQLKAEKSHSYELGAQYATGITLLRAVAFSTKTRNQFAIDPNNCSELQCASYNLDRGSNEGVEFSASGKLDQTDMRASLTLQNPIDDSTGKTLTRRAKVLGAFSVSHTMASWRASGDLIFAGKSPDPSSPDGYLGAYARVNFMLRNQISKDLSAYVRVENVFDAHYQTAYGYNQMPRGLYVGMNWQH